MYINLVTFFWIFRSEWFGHFMQSIFLLFALFLDLSGFENLTGLKDTATIRASLLSY